MTIVSGASSMRAGSRKARNLLKCNALGIKEFLSRKDYMWRMRRAIVEFSTRPVSIFVDPI
jgi:hypothetical protein